MGEESDYGGAGEEGVTLMRLNQILSNPNIPDDVEVTLTPKPYQLEDLRKHLEWRRSNNFSGVGTGKSLISYLWIMYKLYSGMKVLVVMPPPLLGQYLTNFSQQITGHGFTYARLDKDPAKRKSGMSAGIWPDVLMMSYQLFVKHGKEIRENGRYTAVVADESHQMANASSQAFQEMFRAIYMQDMDLISMTATPCPTELRSAYGHIRLKKRDAYVDLAQFDRIHVDWVPFVKDQIAGYKQLDLLSENLNYRAVRRRQEDVLSLEKPTIIDHHILLDDAHQNLYQQLLLERMLEFGEELIVARNQQSLRQMALQLVTNIGVFTLEKIDNEPLDNLRQIVDSIEGKVVVFCHFRKTVESLAHVFKGRNPALVYGGSNVSANVDKFLKDDSCTIAIMNYRSGGAGFNLQENCHHMIFYEPTGSPGDFEQALGRVQRLGQKRPVVAWVFRYAFTSSTRLFGKAVARAKELKQIMKDNTSFVDNLTTEIFSNVPEIISTQDGG